MSGKGGVQNERKEYMPGGKGLVPVKTIVSYVTLTNNTIHIGLFCL